MTLISDLTLSINSLISLSCGFSLDDFLTGFDVLGLEHLLNNV